MKEEAPVTRFYELVPGDLLVNDGRYPMRLQEQFVLAVRHDTAIASNGMFPVRVKTVHVLYLSSPNTFIGYHDNASFDDHGWRLIR